MVSLSMIVLAAIITIFNTNSSQNQLIKENAEAMADDPIDWEESDDGESGAGFKCLMRAEWHPSLRVKSCHSGDCNDTEHAQTPIDGGKKINC